MIAALLGGLLLSTVPARVEVSAEVSEDLSTIRAETVTEIERALHIRTVTVALSADRLRDPIEVPAASEREVYVRRMERGGFADLRIRVNDVSCSAKPEPSPAGGRQVRCPVPAPRRILRVTMKATLHVPERYGPLGRVRGQLTLGGGWYPFVEGAIGPHRARVRIPNGRAAVVGARWWAATDSPRTRTLEITRSSARQLPLVVLPPGTVGRRVAGGRVWLVSPRLDGHRPDSVRWAEQMRVVAVQATRHLLQARRTGFTRARPLVLVEAPLRHDLARAADGVVLVSDRAFRISPFERFYRFHRYPVLREVFRGWARRRTVLGRPPEDGLGEAAADAVAVSLLDDFIRAQAAEAEDAFDVLSFWSWIPAVDRLLYQPQLPFVGAYFARADETDPLRIPIVAPEATHARGKRIYDKLVDRLGAARVRALTEAILNGTSLTDAVAAGLGDRAAAGAFLKTWLGPYPEVRFSLEGVETELRSKEPVVYNTTVHVARNRGAPAEPLTVQLEGDGKTELTRTETSTRALLSVSATTSFAVDRVSVDPFGRMSETPSEDVPQPRFDNRSRASWRLLLNNFNVALSPSAGTVDTALDVGFSRVYDLFWRFGSRAAYGPDAVSVSVQARRFFGARRTPDRLLQWVGGALVGEYLRPDFTAETSDAYALTATMFYGFDDRTTVWAAEPGTALRASVAYTRALGRPPAETTADALSLAVRGLRSWRFDASHQFSLRASVGAFVVGRPREQQQFFLGGRTAVRGFAVDAEVGRIRGLLSGEWVHGLMVNRSWNAANLAWVTGVDGAFFGDVALIGNSADRLGFRADVGYGLRVYLDYFGVRPGVMAVDLAIPLTDLTGAWNPGGLAVYIDFAQSFLVF